MYYYSIKAELFQKKVMIRTISLAMFTPKMHSKVFSDQHFFSHVYLYVNYVFYKWIEQFWKSYAVQRRLYIILLEFWDYSYFFISFIF